MFGPQVLDRTGRLVRAQNRLDAELTRYGAGGRADPGRRARRAEVDAVLAARARPAVARPRRTGWSRDRAGAGAAAGGGRGFAAGRITAEQVAVIAPVAGREHQAAAAEQGVDLAGGRRGAGRDRRHPPATPSSGRWCTTTWPGWTPTAPSPTPPRAGRCRSPSTPTAAVTGRFDLDAVGGEKVQAALESIAQADRPAGDLRTRAQQLGDAFVQLADNALAAGHPADAAHGQAARGGHHRPRRLRRPARPAPAPPRTGFGARISAARARWLACDGNITRIVIGPDGQPLDLGPQPPGRPAAPAPGASRSGTGTACSPAATPRPTGATSTTCCTGSTAARPRWRTPRCCANGTTRRSTTASGSSDNPTADGAPGAPTAPRSSCIPTCSPLTSARSTPSGLRRRVSAGEGSSESGERGAVLAELLRPRSPPAARAAARRW